MSDRPRIIGLYSPAPGSGKTTLARYLSYENYVILPFAEPLKRMTRVLLMNLGYGPLEIDELLTEDKERLLPQIRTTTRHILQTLGTEFGRGCIHPDLWLFCWQARADRFLQAGASVICDDVRFHNEADLIRSMGGEIWHLSRPGVTSRTSHASEGSLDDYPHFSRFIDNSGSIHDLYAQLPPALTPAAV